MSNVTSYNPTVLESRILFMMRAQELTSEGYHHYVQGTIDPLKAAIVVRRFRDTYQVHLDKNARYLRKKAGLGNAKLLLRLNENGQLDFLLLISPGDHPAQKLENLKDARTDKGRLEYRGFSMVPQTRKGSSKPSWTWQMTPETFAAWTERIRLDSAHNNQHSIRQTLHALYMTPGFAGVRKQVGALISAWRSMWKEARGSAGFPMTYPHNDLKYRRRDGVVQDRYGKFWTVHGFPSGAQLPKLFYVRKQVDDGRCLSSVVRAAKSLHELFR